MKVPESVLKEGAQGEPVITLHQCLQQLQYDVPAKELSKNIFGKGTQKLVTRFQREHGLEPTGFVDTQTTNALIQAATANSAISQTLLQNGSILGSLMLKTISKPCADTLPTREIAADLLRIAPDPKVRSALAERGITREADIAAQLKSDFVKAMAPAIGQRDAEALHVIASVRSALTDSVWTKGAFEKGKRVHVLAESPSPPVKPNESALSVHAYLTDLLHYVLCYISDKSQWLTLETLTNRFHQDFWSLLLATECIKEPVRQVRVAVEVLRNYLKAHPLGAAGQKKLKQVEGEYCFNAYTALLRNIGTSFDELRLLPSREERQKRALADRLGIEYDDAGTTLSELLLDPTALTEEHLEQIFGLRSTKTDLSTTPVDSRLETLRLQHLRAVWLQEDMPNDDYLSRKLPVIDPDVIGPDDFRYPDPSVAPFDLWLERRQWVDGQLQLLRAMSKLVRGENAPDFERLFNAMTAGVDYMGASYPCWPSSGAVATLKDAYGKILAGAKVEDVRDTIEGTFYLNVPAWMRLMELLTKAMLWEEDERAARIGFDEWDEIVSILIQVQKTALYPAWINIENTNAPWSFSPLEFWKSLTEPPEGNWPTERAAEGPWIDPEQLKDTDFPDWSLEDCRSIMQSRSAVLAQLRSDLKKARMAEGFEGLIVAALGSAPIVETWSEWLDQISTALLDPDENVVKKAQQSIQDNLKVGDNEFRFIALVKSKVEAGQQTPEKRPQLQEWDQLERILASAHKLKVLYPAWQSEDFPIKYWMVRKAQLPRWRASGDARRKWQQALQNTRQPPVIDPDLIDKSYLRSAQQGAALDILKSRQELLLAWERKLQRLKQGTPIAAFEAIVSSCPTLTVYRLKRLEADYAAGKDISAALDQVLLSAAGFLRLKMIHQIASLNQPVLDADWRDVFSILISVVKQILFAKFPLERTQNISLSPDLFLVPDQDERELNLWRASPDALTDWRDKLQARVTQEKALFDELQQLWGATDEVALPTFRDSLILLTSAGTLPELAAVLSERLLIDLQVAGSQKTTRLAQAISTVQSLIWGVRTRQLDAYPDMRLISRYFNEEWTWLRSYADWRSAISVVLYPQNLLLPQLRLHMSPVLKQLAASSDEFTPESASLATAEYAAYLDELTNLILEASATALISDEGDRRRTIYCFARSKKSGKVYWCSRLAPNEQETFWSELWAELPTLGTEVTRILGAVVHKGADSGHVLCVFAKAAKNNKERLLMTRRSLTLPGDWSTAKELTLKDPDNPLQEVSTFDARVMRTPPWTSPYVFVGFDGGPMSFGIYLNAQADDWATNFQRVSPDLAQFLVWGGWLHLNDGPSLSNGTDLDGGAGVPVRFACAGRFIKGVSLLAIANDTAINVMAYDPEAGSWRRRYQTLINADFGVAGDFDGDGADELVLHEVSSLSLCFVDYRGADSTVDSFAMCTNLDIGDFILAGDFDRDGRDEVVIGQRVRSPSNPNITNIGLRLYDLNFAGIWSENVPIPDNVLLGVSSFAVCGDFDGDGRDEIAIAIMVRSGPTKFLVVAYDTQKPFSPWNVVSEFMADFRDGTNTYTAKFAVAGDFDGDGRTEIAIAPDASGPLGNDFLVMDFDPSSHAWKHLGEFGTKPADFSADIAGTCTVPAKYAVAGDFDGDGRDEIAIAPDAIGSLANDFWVMDYDTWTQRWYPLTPIAGYPNGTSFDCSGTKLGTKLAVAGRFGGARSSIAILPDNKSDKFWVMELAASPLHLGSPASVLLALNPAQRRNNSKLAYDSNCGVNLHYVDEVFMSFPLLIALKLQAGGHYVQALDWFRAVYDYGQPQGQRNAFWRLLAEVRAPLSADYPGVFSRLLQPLNPHRIAEYRYVAYTEYVVVSIIRCLLEYADSEFSIDTSESLARADTLYGTVLELFDSPAMRGFADEVGCIDFHLDDQHCLPFFVPPNPVPKALYLYAQVNLFKLRSGRNISGMKRQVEAYAHEDSGVETGFQTADGMMPVPIPVLRPTPYRYRVLIQRAKELAQHAQQIESSMFDALVRYDDNAYSMLKAQQDVKLTEAQLRVQDLRCLEMQDGAILATMQYQKSAYLVDRYNSMIAAGLNIWEQDMVSSYQNMLKAKEVLAKATAAMQWEQHISTFGADFIHDIIAGATYIGTLIGSLSEGNEGNFIMGALNATLDLNNLEAAAAIDSINAAQERRAQEWGLQRDVAAQDMILGAQQQQIANDQVQVANQERFIAQLQSDHSKVVVEFLANKFTSTELFFWMSTVLKDVYRFFLQEAVATARLAEQQLAFERHEGRTFFIRPDYWQALARGGSGNIDNVDRKGLTGSARLLEDIYRLDQFAFATDQRKLQLTKTISLMQLAPYEFERFRQTGVMSFRTPMKLFDCDFPGHYLRLIKNVRTTVIALIPPAQGIKATLSCSGISRVVSGDNYQTTLVRRDPESVALSSALNASGVFELQQEGEMLLPFEASGVDTNWEFVLPKASNLFDYSTIADVLLTIDYTALVSPDYRQQVISKLNHTLLTNRCFSFRQQFSDAWYELNNPDQSDTPMNVRFKIRREDFPFNLDTLKLSSLLLYFAGSEELLMPAGRSFTLKLTDSSGGKKEAELPLERSARALVAFTNYNPVGEWELVLPNTFDVRALFQDGGVTDIAAILTYAGRLCEWPR